MNATQFATDPTTRPLAGRVAVVTGATSGIGAAVARRLAAAGASVVVTGRRADRLDALAAELPDVVAVAADVSARSALDPVVAAARELGGADLVVANAGTMSGAPFEAGDAADWDRMLDVNLRGLLATGRAFAPGLLAAAAEGRAADLVLVSSANAHDVYPGWAVYGATKAAVSHLARNLRAEYGPRGVRVKRIEPGITATELGDDITHAPSREMVAQAARQSARWTPTTSPPRWPSPSPRRPRSTWPSCSSCRPARAEPGRALR